MREHQFKFRLRYDDESDRFCLETNIGDGWELCISSQCKNADGEEKHAPKMYVHCTILIEMQKLIDRGYTMVN